MGSIDDFLKQLANQHQEKQQQLNNQQSSLSSVNTSNQMNSNEDNIDTYISHLEEQKKKDDLPNVTDDLLQEIETSYQPQKTSKSSTSQELFLEIEQKFQQEKKNQNISQEDSSIIDNSIRQIVRHSHSKTKNYQEQKTVNNLTDIQQEELNKQRQIKQLTQQAQIWLKNLDPNSEEGFWFEQFALSYPSKLEAAIDYLKALADN